MEIDIVEHRAVHGLGESAGKDARDLRAMALHWDGSGERHKSTGHGSEQARSEPSLQGNWHTYAVLWTPGRYVFYLNGKEQWSTLSPLPGSVSAMDSQTARFDNTASWIRGNSRFY